MSKNVSAAVEAKARHGKIIKVEPLMERLIRIKIQFYFLILFIMVRKMDSDDNVKKIARFLENGGTMLANHCDSCGAPLFRFKGEIICPLCSDVETDVVTAPVKKESAPQKNNKAGKKQAAPVAAADNIRNTAIEPTVYSAEEEQLRELILLKLTAVAQDMQNENDPRRVFEYLEIIEKGLDLIERLG